MKLLHTADWHIGKQLNQFDLLSEQKAAFQQIATIAKEQMVDGILIAGDLYDRAIPSIAAVEAFDAMLKTLNLDLGLPIYAISGNHDGANRLNFARDWFGKAQLFLNTQLAEAMQPIETATAQIFLLPFFDPQDARTYYQVSIESNEMRTIQQAMERVITDLVAQFKPNKRHILVTHFNVQGTDNENYELTSETTSTVGGLNSVPAALLAPFDYVALGHLHLWQASPARNIRYSGSPVKFNTKEATNEKGVYIVDIPDDDSVINTTFIPLKPEKDLIVLRGTFAELCDATKYANLPGKGAAFYSIRLLDRPHEQNIRHQLEDIYGDIVELEYPVPTLTQNKVSALPTQATAQSDLAIITEFYATVMAPATLTTNQTAIVSDTLITIRKESENA